MATVNVLNADAAISGKTLVNIEDAQTITGVKTHGANLLFTDNTYDIGASGATRPRDLFLSRNATIGGTLGVTGVTTLTGAVAVGDFRGTAETITATGTVNDQALAATTTILRCNNASLLTITGFASGTAGRILIVQSVGAGRVDLRHQNTGSAAANRAIHFVTSGDTSLAAGSGVATYYYDGTQSRWVLIHHTQGAAITFTPIFGGETSESGQVYTIQVGRYLVSGNQVHVQGRLQLSTLGTITGDVRIKSLPYTAANITNAYSAVSLGFVSALTTAVVSVRANVVPNTTAAEFVMRTAAATGETAMAQGDFSATSDVIFAADYVTD